MWFFRNELFFLKVYLHHPGRGMRNLTHFDDDEWRLMHETSRGRTSTVSSTCSTGSMKASAGFFLCEAPSKEAAEAVHREAHGLSIMPLPVRWL